MKKNLIWLLAACSGMYGVGPIVSGQSLWCISKRIGSSVDIIESKLCDISAQVSLFDEIQCSKLDIVQENAHESVSKLCIADSVVDEITGCLPGVIMGETTITQSGVYCVGQNFTGNITLMNGVSDVLIDLNNHVIMGTISGSNIRNLRIKDGVIQQAGMGDAIAITGGSHIDLHAVTAKGARRGVNFEGVVGGRITHCSFTQNVTGIELDQSAKITIDSCSADCNLNAGFCLLSSTTCCLTNCKALSTGEGNTQTENAVIAGFVSTDGNANIFERCIANSTQALSTTDFNSVVAGFALRGDERCSKIIECETANAQTSLTGVTVPYGIVLESRFVDATLTLTAAPEIPELTAQTPSVDWSSDGTYLLVSSGNIFAVYQFDYVSSLLSRVAFIENNNVPTDDTFVEWHPNDRTFVASSQPSGAVPQTVLFEFDPTNNTITNRGSSNRSFASITDQINGFDWHPDGLFVAYGALIAPSTGQLSIDKFDPVAQTLTAGETVATLGSATFAKWHPSGTVLAVGDRGTNPEPPGLIGFVRLFSFENETVTQRDTQGFSVAFRLDDAAWSPDGNYLATTDATNNSVAILRLDDQTLTLVLEETAGAILENVTGVSWSADGAYIALAGESASVPVVRAYFFDRSTNTLTVEATSNAGPPTPGGSAPFRELSWSPDGSHIAVGGNTSNSAGLYLYEALAFPRKNLIKDTVAYCNSGGAASGGIGISGSSIENMIIGNTAYNNGSSTNYSYVTNLYKPRYQQEPTAIQNISLGGCEPICMPEDNLLLNQQLLQTLCDFIDTSKLDVMESKIDTIQATQLCNPIAILASDLPTVLAGSNVYCLAEDAAGMITINGSNVHLNLNNHTLTGGIVSSGHSQLTIENGTVHATGATGIACDTADLITINGVQIDNAQIGLNLESINAALVRNCSFSMNTTGIEVDRSHAITIDSCSADCNLNAGFCLLSSTTCCVINCKAISTGEGNTQTENALIAGFVSTDGNGNMFERCIANSTQALSTTDSNSLVAGFALRGNERCTKIIGCESANAQTDFSGFTVPYGILLEAQFDGLTSVTSINPEDGGADSILAVSWSPDGQYLAVGGTINALDRNDLFVYRFDRAAESLTQVDSVSPGGASADIRAVSWSPDWAVSCGRGLYFWQRSVCISI